MTGFRRSPRCWQRQGVGRTPCGLMGLLVFLAGAPLWAQALWGNLGQGKATKAPAGVLGAPTEVIPATDKTEVKPAVGREKIGPLWPPHELPPAGFSAADREPFPSQSRLDLPGVQTLFRLESEKALQERMRQEALQRTQGKKLYFPDMETIRTGKHSPRPRQWQPLAEVVEPCAMGFRRLYFHQINFERYGWDVGFFTPVVSAGTFYFDFLTFPLQLVAEPRRCWEYNSAWCLPGDPVPFLLYPPRPK